MVEKVKNNLRKRFLLMVGGMGHSSTVAAGYGINSKSQIICLDGDGSVLMHLGTLRTIGYAK